MRGYDSGMFRARAAILTALALLARGLLSAVDSG